MELIKSLSTSELLFYGGITTMVIALIITLSSIFAFTVSGLKIKRQLEKEYGDTK